MSRTLDLLVDSNIHGTPEGYRAGCKTGHCPSPVLCRDVYVRYVGDWGFARRVDAGESPAAIIAAEVADAQARAERDRVAARAEKRLQHEKHVAREQRKAPKPRRVAAPKQKKGPRVTAADLHGAEITRLHGLGLSDVAIAAALGIPHATANYVRAKVLNLPVNPRSAGLPVQWEQVRVMHGQGMTDGQIAEKLGVGRAAVWKARTKLGLHINKSPRSNKSRVYPDHEADIRGAHAEGLTDAQIAVRLGIGKMWVAELRRRMGLPFNKSGRRAS